MPIILRKRAGSENYYARGSYLGEPIDQSTRTGDRALAELVVDRWKAEIKERLIHGERRRISFAEAALTYMESGGERRFLAPILRYFGDQALDDIDQAAVNAAASALYPKAAPATINRQLITPISAVIALAADSGLTRARRIRRRREKNARLRWITPEEAERLFAALDRMAADPARAGEAARQRAILAFLLGTGARTGELVALDAALFYGRTGEAYIADSKSGQARRVELPERARLAVLAGPIAEAGPLFRTPKGRPYTARQAGGGQFKAMFDALGREAGVAGLTPHILRHTWATWIFAATRDFRRLMDLGGWSRPDMALRYVKAAPADLAERLAAHGWHFEAPAAAARFRRRGGA